MILYSLLRAIAGIALRWYYSEIEVRGLERLPSDTPVILVANHPNALIDALAIGWAVPRPVRLTAKGTLFAHPLIGPLFRSAGMIPLHRASDLPIVPGTNYTAAAAGTNAPKERHAFVNEASTRQAGNDRNADSFRAILNALRRRSLVLIFPEGTTHSRSELVPLKSGAARLALAARADQGLADVQLVAVGLFFEDKSRPRSRVLVQFGPPLSVDAWAEAAADSVPAVRSLTTAIDQRLRAVTLNFPTSGDAIGVTRIARLLSDALAPPRPVAAPHLPLGDEFFLIRRVDAARRIIASAHGMDHSPSQDSDSFRHPSWAHAETQDALTSRARALLLRIEAFDRNCAATGLAVNDIDISLSTALGVRFALREGGVAVGTAPLSWWGRINHWLPFRIAGAMGRRPGLNPEDPAMHTIAWGVAVVLLAYAVQTALVAWLLGGWWSLAYLVSLPPSASWDLRYRDRLSRAFGRMQAYRLFRHDPALQQRLAEELRYLRAEAVAIDQLLDAGMDGAREQAADISR